MGNCFECCLKTNHSQNYQLRQSRLQAILTIDQGHPFYQNFQQDNKIFTKKKYDWSSLPIITNISKKNQTIISIKNQGVNKQNFLFGLIVQNDLLYTTKMPWKTASVICFESHQNKKQSGFVHKGVLQVGGRGIKKNQIIKMIVKGNNLSFYVQDEKICQTTIPDQFLNQRILPYIALFDKGDSISILNQIKINRKK